jgi:cardiolipin synthase
VGGRMKKQNKDVLKQVLTIPNVMSFFRLCLIPLIVWLYCIEENYHFTGCIIIISGLTDVLDGFIARKFNLISDLGKILDPIADKFTQLAVLICLVTRFPWMLLPIISMVIKETLVGITGFLAIQKSGKVTGAHWHGKVATVLLYGMMILHMFWISITHTVSAISIGLCTVMIFISFFFYLTENIKAIKLSDEEKKNQS